MEERSPSIQGKPAATKSTLGGRVARLVISWWTRVPINCRCSRAMQALSISHWKTISCPACISPRSRPPHPVKRLATRNLLGISSRLVSSRLHRSREVVVGCCRVLRSQSIGLRSFGLASSRSRSPSSSSSHSRVKGSIVPPHLILETSETFLEVISPGKPKKRVDFQGNEGLPEGFGHGAHESKDGGRRGQGQG